jgi:hypothetical protein
MRNTQKLKNNLVGDGYTKQINEALREFLKDKGYSQNLPEALNEYLGDSGYDKSLSERLKQWDDNNLHINAAISPRRYWRLLFTEIGTFVGSALAELEFYEEIDGPNIATGGTPIAGNEDFGGTKEQAFDGNKTTSFWACNGIGSYSWIGYNFATNVAVRQFGITSRDGSDGNQVGNEWLLQWSNDGVSWTTQQTYVDETAWGPNQEKKYRV